VLLTATHNNILQNTLYRTLQHTATYNNTLQHTLYRTLQHTATHCNTHCKTPWRTLLTYTAACVTVRCSVCHTVLQRVSHCVALQYVLQCFVVCCSELSWVAVWCRVLQSLAITDVQNSVAHTAHVFLRKKKKPYILSKIRILLRATHHCCMLQISC